MALAHDFVHRRNIRIATKERHDSSFILSTFGSHHIRLVNHVVKVWNQLLKTGKYSITNLETLPEMSEVASNETFGLARSMHTSSPCQVEVSIQAFEDDILDLPLEDEFLDTTAILGELDIDPSLCFVPLETLATASAPKANLNVREDSLNCLSDAHRACTAGGLWPISSPRVNASQETGND